MFGVIAIARPVDRRLEQTVSGGRINEGIPVVIDDSHVTVTLAIAGNAAVGTRTVRLMNATGNSNAVNFTVQ